MLEIWSIALTREGIAACAMTPEMKTRTFHASWPESEDSNICTVAHAAVRRLVARACHELLAGTADDLPLAIGLCAPDEETAVFIDRFGVCQTPVYWDMPLTVPKCAIPDKYASAELASVYRNSVLRRLQQQHPLLGDNQSFGVLSVGALTAQWLTGHAVSATLPLGVPLRFPVFESENRERLYAAMGIHPQYSMKPARCGHVFARISPDIVENLAALDMPELAELAGIPVFDLGACEAARAYACAANPLSWAACVGWQTQVHWTASVTALAEFEIQIIEKSEKPSNTTHPDDEIVRRPEEMSADDWTMLWSRHLNMAIHAGPRQSLASYGCKLHSLQASWLCTAFKSLISNHGRIPFASLKKAPLGSAGLHIWHDDNGWNITGLQAAHTPAHLARACFEGQIYAIRQWRESLDYPVCGPLRLMLSAPWPPECAQWAADILNAPVIYIENTSQEQAAFGAAIALIRDLEMQTDAKPRLEAVIIEPQERAAYYTTHYQIHRQLVPN